jgi:GNAT superfamily N-acetyltransferase
MSPTSPSADIRRCRPGDFDTILALLGQLWPDTPPDPAAARTIFDRALASTNQACFCAAINDRLIAFGAITFMNVLWPKGPSAHINELVVDLDHRGRGVGSQLLLHLLSYAREAGCRRVELDSGHHRNADHQFYLQHGFENRACLFSKPL